MNPTEPSTVAPGGSRRPGPRRPESAPAGPDQVREAVLETATRLFTERGVDRVSLRDIAREANVQLPLIGRYIGLRRELIDTVYRRLAEQLVEVLGTQPLEPLPDGPQSVLRRWMAMVNYYTTVGEPSPTDVPSPLAALAEVLQETFGLDPRTSRVRAAQVAAIAFGWHLFGGYFLETAGFDDSDAAELRRDLNAIQRRIGATPWPTPPAEPPDAG